MRRLFGHSCWREIVCLVSATLLFGSSMLEAKVGISGPASRGQSGAATRPTLKERILEVPPGTMIEVRLLNKQKIRGRLGEVTDEGFSVQTAQGNKIDTQKVAFTDVKSVKKLEGSTGTKIGKGVVYALAGVGVLTFALIIWAASASD